MLRYCRVEVWCHLLPGDMFCYQYFLLGVLVSRGIVLSMIVLDVIVLSEIKLMIVWVLFERRCKRYVRIKIARNA